MKKSQLLFLGLIALVLAGGLALASCGPDCPANGKCKTSQTSLTIDCKNGCIDEQRKKRLVWGLYLRLQVAA